MNKKRLLPITTVLIFTLIIINLISISASQNNNSTTEIHNTRNNFEIFDLIDKNTNSNLKINYPLSTFSAFVEKNKTFNITFNYDSFNQLFVYLSTAYEPVVDLIKLEIENIAKSNSNWHAKVKVPIDTPEELYNLTIIIEKMENSIQQRSQGQ